MIRIDDKSKCCGCTACMNICPGKCIQMTPDREGFLYPQVDEEKCIGCDLCIKVCPIQKEKKEKENKAYAYAAFSKQKAIREQSTSGGIFTLLAEKILAENGVVFGCGFDEEHKVAHRLVKTPEELEGLRGSKYVQSSLGTVFREVKKYLEADVPVYFSGTPCQVEGLRAFLGKDYQGLYLQDIICHGVPSPLIWEKYKKKHMDSSGNIQRISFRSKEKGWQNYRLRIDFEGGKSYSAGKEQDPFLLGFLQDAQNRPSCHDCYFKGAARNSDITLADFWGIEQMLPEMNDDLGTSLVICHSEKGKLLLQSVRQHMECREVDVKQALKYNPSALHSSAPAKGREKFFHEVESLGYERAVKRLLHVPLIKKIWRKIKGNRQ